MVRMDPVTPHWPIVVQWEEGVWFVVERSDWVRDSDLHRFAEFPRVIDASGRFLVAKKVKGARVVQFFEDASPPDLVALADELEEDPRVDRRELRFLSDPEGPPWPDALAAYVRSLDGRIERLGSDAAHRVLAETGVLEAHTLLLFGKEGAIATSFAPRWFRKERARASRRALLRSLLALDGWNLHFASPVTAGLESCFGRGADPDHVLAKVDGREWCVVRGTPSRRIEFEARFDGAYMLFRLLSSGADAALAGSGADGRWLFAAHAGWPNAGPPFRS